ncbi:MAG: hypothetical protein ACKVS9_06185 [Phycisphaerae bacterium]
MKYEIELRRATWQSGKMTIVAVNAQQAHAIAASVEADTIARWHAPASFLEVVAVTECEEPKPAEESAGDGGLASEGLPPAIRVALREVIDHFYEREAFDFDTSEHRHDHVFERLLTLARWLHEPERVT